MKFLSKLFKKQETEKPKRRSRRKKSLLTKVSKFFTSKKKKRKTKKASKRSVTKRGNRMNVTLDLTKSHVEIAKALRELADKLDPECVKQQDESPKKVTEEKKAKKTDMKVVEETFEDETAETVESFDDMPEDSETVEDNEEIIEDEEPALTLDKDILPAFQKFAKVNGMQKAKDILGKFKVKAAKDLDEDDYPKVLKMLGVKVKK